MDGIDIAYLESDGVTVSSYGGCATHGYANDVRNRLRRLISGFGNRDALEEELTLIHWIAVRDFLKRENLNTNEIDLVGFHGHTIDHDPEKARTVQIGDGALLAHKLNIPVVNDFRSNDIRHGGQGAPLVPAFHAVLTAELEKPIAVLNIGGVANVTWVGAGDGNLLAFDTGPGNSLIDDWISRHGVGEYDISGRIAAKGSLNGAVLEQFLDHPYFKRKPPKSLDRNEFSLDLMNNNGLENGAATLNAFTVESIKISQTYFPSPVNRWIICGGGRHNRFMVSQLRDLLEQPVINADELGWQGDAIEAQAFAYLAIRSNLGLPISFPNTTGVKIPLTGGVYHVPNKEL